LDCFCRSLRWGVAFAFQGAVMRDWESPRRWSYSAWESYQRCPAYYKYRHIDRLPEPPNQYAARGTELHQSAEDFVSGKSNAVDGAFTYHYKHLEYLKHEVDAKTEYKIALDNQWKLVEWGSKDAWTRMVLDAYYVEETPKGKIDVGIVDYKSGKVREKHIAQMQLYAIGAMSVARHYDAHWDLNEVGVHLLYIDQQHTTSYAYTLADENTLQQNWENSVEALQHDEKFLPMPGQHCSWCHFSKRNKGPCKFQ
jgi:CRISPR/Cas system-associated exonuclease Cas4 (RecB family)